MRTEISARVHIKDNKGELLVRKAFIGDGEWKHVPSNVQIPEECRLDAKLWVTNGDTDELGLLYYPLKVETPDLSENRVREICLEEIQGIADRIRLAG